MERWTRWVHEQVFLLLAVAAAVVTALLIFRFLSAADQKTAVVLAAKDIPPGAEITAGMIREVTMHPSGLHPEALTEAGLAVGRFSLVPVHQGEQVLSSQVSDDQGSRGFLAEMTGTERAMFLPVTLARGLGGAVTKGDRVDIIFVPSEQKMGRSGVATVLESARVLDVRDDRGMSRQNEEGKDSGFLGVLLAVQPEQAERLAFYLEHGQLFLSLGGFRAVPTGQAGKPGLVLPAPEATPQGPDGTSAIPDVEDFEDIQDIQDTPLVTP